MQRPLSPLLNQLLLFLSQLVTISSHYVYCFLSTDSTHALQITLYRFYYPYLHSVRLSVTLFIFFECLGWLTCCAQKYDTSQSQLLGQHQDRHEMLLLLNQKSGPLHSTKLAQVKLQFQDLRSSQLFLKTLYARSAI